MGEYPFRTTRMVAWLSSSMRSVTLRPSNNSHNCKAGRPSWYKECGRDTTSDSVVERDVDVCRLLTQASGKKVLGPCSTRNPPDVDLPVRRSPAKSASTYKRSSRCSGSSSIVPTKRYWGVELIYCMSLQNLLSSPWTKTVLLLQGR